MPGLAKLVFASVLVAVVGGAVALILVRGPAIILDMAAGAVGFICL